MTKTKLCKTGFLVAVILVLCPGILQSKSFGPEERDISDTDYKRYLEYRRMYENRQEDREDDRKSKRRNRSENYRESYVSDSSVDRKAKMTHVFLGVGQEKDNGVYNIGGMYFTPESITYKGVNIFYIDSENKPSNYEDEGVPHQDYTVLKDFNSTGEFGINARFGLKPNSIYFGGILGISFYREDTLVESNTTGIRWLEDDDGDRKIRPVFGGEIGFAFEDFLLSAEITSRYDYAVNLGWQF